VIINLRLEKHINESNNHEKKMKILANSIKSAPEERWEGLSDVLVLYPKPLFF
jgi:hypothetical protein